MPRVIVRLDENFLCFTEVLQGAPGSQGNIARYLQNACNGGGDKN